MKILRKTLDAMNIFSLGIALFGVGFNIRTSTKIAYILYALAAIYTALAIIQSLSKK